MNDRVFVDSNIFLYLVRDEKGRKEKAIEILNSNPLISTQVIGENIFVCRKKFALPVEQCLVHGEYLLAKCRVMSITVDITRNAIKISRRYGYSIWDCFIIATALLNNCSILYSEDLQHKQLIEKKLTIINPFL